MTDKSVFRTKPLRNINGLFLFLCVVYNHSLICAISGQFQLSPYVDTNVQESLNNPTQTFGLKLRGDLHHEFSRSKWNIYEDILAQTFLDARFIDESKLILNSDLTVQYQWVPNILIVSQFSYFQKSFYEQTRSHRWSEYNIYLQFLPHRKITANIGYFFRSTTFTSLGKFRFDEYSYEMRGKFQLNPRFSIETAAILGNITYKDFAAWDIENDTLLISLDVNQKDRLARNTIHFRYRGKIIYGLQLGFEWVNSNSAIGEYILVSYQGYFSGRVGETFFYHLVLQRVDKNYRYPDLSGISGYRDPEEKIQNRSYIQIERVMVKRRVVFIKVSLFENETILNQRYYDKTVIEVGIKYKL